jgi:hypothetical protein
LTKKPYFCGSFSGTDTKNQYTVMGVTELKRKARKNRARATNKIERIKFLLTKPTITNVDVEAIKAEFAAKKAQAAQA